MNIEEKITALKKERTEQEAIEAKAHARVIEINRKIRSAEVILRDAGELFADEEKLVIEADEQTVQNRV